MQLDTAYSYSCSIKSNIPSGASHRSCWKTRLYIHSGFSHWMLLKDSIAYSFGILSLDVAEWLNCIFLQDSLSGCCWKTQLHIPSGFSHWVLLKVSIAYSFGIISLMLPKNSVTYSFSSISLDVAERLSRIFLRNNPAWCYWKTQLNISA